MKRSNSITSLLAIALFAGTATTALAQNVTAGEKAGEKSAPATIQKEMTNPTKGDHEAVAGSKHDKVAAAFKKADKDHDGTLDKKEAKGMPNVAKNFDAMDTDKDSTVSWEEIQTFMKAKNNSAMN